MLLLLESGIYLWQHHRRAVTSFATQAVYHLGQVFDFLKELFFPICLAVAIVLLSLALS